MPARPSVVAALALLCASLPAQDSYRERAAAWRAAALPHHLASRDATEVAWAAWWIGEEDVRSALPAVREALARLAAEPDRDSRLARAQLLDLLIRWDVLLPAEELLRHAEGSLRRPTLVLACKAPEANERYFAARFAVGGSDAEWQVCGSWLAFWKRREMVEQCLQRFVLPLRIVVDDGGREAYGTGTPPGPRPETSEMPPMPRYEIQAGNRELRHEGRPSLRYRRMVVEDPLLGDPSSMGKADVQACLCTWLPRLGGEKTREACERQVERVVEPMSAGALRTIVRRERGRAERAFEAMVAEMRRLGAIDAEAAAELHPTIALQVVDRRRRRPQPLPSVEWLLEERR